MKKWIFLAVTGILAVFIVGCMTSQQGGGVPRISKEELRAKLGSSDMLHLDVRTEHDWENSDWKISGAVRKDPLDFDSRVYPLPMDREIILYRA